MKCTGVVHAELKVGDKIITTLFYVMKSLEYGIWSMVALKQLGTNIDTVTGSTFVDGMVVGNTVSADQNIVTARCYHIRLKQSTVIGPGEEKLLTGVAEVSAPCTGLVEASDSFIQRTGLLAAPVQVQEGSVEFPLCVINIWDKPIRVYRGQNIAEFTETETPFTRDRTNSRPCSNSSKSALRSHGTIEIGRIRAPFAGRIRDQKKLGLFFVQVGFKV